MIIRRSSSIGQQLPYAVGRFAQSDDSYIINQALGDSPFGSFLCSLGSSYAIDISPDGTGRTWFAGTEVTSPDGRGKAWYLRDRDSGSLWSAFFDPVGERADDYEVRYSPGQVEVFSLKDKIACTLTISVAPEHTCELWCVKLENRSTRDRTIEFTTYAQPFIGSSLEARYLERERALVLRAPLEALGADRLNPDFVFFQSATLTPSRFQTNQSDFVGHDRSMRNPQHLEENSCGSDAGVSGAATSLSVLVELPIEGEAEFGFCFGMAKGAEQALHIVRSFPTTEVLTSTVKAAGRRWKELCGAAQVDTPDRVFNALVNTWLPYEAYAEWVRERAGSTGLDPSRVADLLKAIYPFAATASEVCRDSLLSFSAGLSLLGACGPGTGSVVQLPASELIWLPMTAATYIAETGDAGVLSLSVDLKDGPSLTLKEHCGRALRLCLGDLPEGESPRASVIGDLLDRWSLVSCEADAICEPAADRLAEKPDPPEQRNPPRRIGYFQSISPSLADPEVAAFIEAHLGPGEAPSGTSVACSAYRALVEGVLGMRATADGLILEPAMPQSWHECAIRRRFQGDVLEIRVRRSMACRDCGATTTVDGESILGRMIPRFGDGKAHRVETVVG